MIFEIKKLADKIQKHIKDKDRIIEDVDTIRKTLYALEQIGYSVELKDAGTVSLPKALTAENGAKALSCRTEWMIQGKYKDGKWIDIDQPRRTKPDITAEQRQKAKSSDCEMRIIRREIREWEVEE